MQRPLGFVQNTAIRFTGTLAFEGLAASIGSVGDVYDKAAAETAVGPFQNKAVAAGSRSATAHCASWPTWNG
ncbi:hypothetical protein [Geodermatophilus sp. URMC 64]